MARRLNSLISSLRASPSTLDFNSSFSALRPRISSGAVLTDPADGLFFDGVLLDGLLVTRPLSPRRAFAAELNDAVDGLFFDGVLLDGPFFDELLALLLAGVFLGDGVFAFLGDLLGVVFLGAPPLAFLLFPILEGAMVIYGVF